MKAYLPVLIPILVPALLALLKSWAPKIPKPWLPMLAPVLGAAIDAITAYLAGNAVNPVLAMALGSAGVGLREVYDQLSGNAQKPILRTILPVLLLAALIGLSACATSPALTNLRETTVADAKLALQWAQEDQDALAVPCYKAIVDILETTTLPVFNREPNGVLTTIYLARSVRKDIEGFGGSTIRQKFLLGCAALVADQRDVLIKMGIKLAPLPFPK